MQDCTEENRGSAEQSSNNYISQAMYEKFLQENVGLIHKVLSPYRELDEYDDLFQEACIGAFKAFLTYDATRNTKLSSYVFTCAQNEVRMYLRKNSAKCRAAITVSLETWDGNPENENRLLECILGSKIQSSPDENMDNQVYMRQVFQTAMGIVKSELDKMAQVTIYQFMNGVPQGVTADMLGKSQSSVSKIFNHALSYLRSRMKDLGFGELA